MSCSEDGSVRMWEIQDLPLQAEPASPGRTHTCTSQLLRKTLKPAALLDGTHHESDCWKPVGHCQHSTTVCILWAVWRCRNTVQMWYCVYQKESMHSERSYFLLSGAVWCGACVWSLHTGYITLRWLPKGNCLSADCFMVPGNQKSITCISCGRGVLYRSVSITVVGNVSLWMLQTL